MLEAASCAPSGGNAQPWAFVVVRDPETRKDVTGRIELKSSEGVSYETRARYTLCRCGGSKNKPYCDGTHWHIGFKDG